MENALRLKVGINLHYKYKSLNPYFFGKCSTAIQLMAQSKFCANVLILIFLENALRQILSLGLDDFNVVLILIFLENALRQCYTQGGVPIEVQVLILIFLENALRLKEKHQTNDFNVLS